MLATFTSADRGRLQLSLRDSGTVPCFARHCQTTSGSANEVSWEGIKSGGRACQRRDYKVNIKIFTLFRIAINLRFMIRVHDWDAASGYGTIVN